MNGTSGSAWQAMTARKPIGPKEILGLAAAVGERFATLVVLAAYTGLTYAEIVALRRNDIDLDHNVARTGARVVEFGTTYQVLPANGSKRTATAIPSVVTKLLHCDLADRHVGAFDYIFSDDSGRPWRRSEFEQSWQRATQAVFGISVAFENLANESATPEYSRPGSGHSRSILSA